MGTIQELEDKIKQLEKDIREKDQQTALLMKKAEQAVDYATHAYRVDHYGFIWVYDVNSKKYCKTEMQLHTPEVKDNSIGTNKLIDNSVIWSKLAADVRNRIESSTYTQYNLALTPEVVAIGQQTEVLIDALSLDQADVITIKRNSMVIATGSGKSLSYTDVITPMGSDSIEYVAEFKHGANTSEISKTLLVSQPIYYGAADKYQDVTGVAPAKITPIGEYRISVSAPGSYIFFLVPANMTIGCALMNGIEVPLEVPESVIFHGYPYKVYKSKNTYNQFDEIVTIL